MAYRFQAVTIRANNSKEAMASISALWEDVSSGKVALLFDSEHHFQQGLSPVSKYSNYASDETGDYDFTIMAVTPDFFREMDEKVEAGLYKKYEAADEQGSLVRCTQKAWETVWSDQKEGKIQRAFTQDYESSVPPQYTKDHQAHCYLYIAVK